MKKSLIGDTEKLVRLKEEWQKETNAIVRRATRRYKFLDEEELKAISDYTLVKCFKKRDISKGKLKHYYLYTLKRVILKWIVQILKEEQQKRKLYFIERERKPRMCQDLNFFLHNLKLTHLEKQILNAIKMGHSRTKIQDFLRSKKIDFSIKSFFRKLRREASLRGLNYENFK